MDNLEQFAQWYLANRPVEIPSIDAIHMMDNLTATTLVRRDKFQVELVVCAPNSEIPDHVHPNVDSIEVYLGGSIMFRHSGQVLVPKEEADAVSWTGLSPKLGMHIRVRPTDVHGGTIGKHGGAFLSIQHWLKGDPTTVGHDWEGEHLGPIHRAVTA